MACMLLSGNLTYCFIHFNQLRQEKIQLEQTLEQEQEYQVNKLMREIDKLESDVTSKQTTLEQVTDYPSGQTDSKAVTYSNRKTSEKYILMFMLCINMGMFKADPNIVF